MFRRNNILVAMTVLLSVLSIHALVVCGTAQATVINVDVLGHPGTGGGFNPVYTGQGAYATADAHFWNPYTLAFTLPSNNTGDPAPMLNLTTSDGTTATTVDFDLTTEHTGGYAGANPTYLNLLDDYAFTFTGGTSSITFTISGLTPLQPYDLYLYGTAGPVAFGSLFHINGLAASTDRKTAGGNDSSLIAGGLASASSVTGSNYVVFSNVLPDGSNNITGTMTTTGDNAFGFGEFNGLQIVFNETSAVPEPGTLTLAALGLVGLGLIAWRRRGRG